MSDLDNFLPKDTVEPEPVKPVEPEPVKPVVPEIPIELPPEPEPEKVYTNEELSFIVRNMAKMVIADNATLKRLGLT